MISLWITIGLIISAASVAMLGAYFSIEGLGALFSGAMVAVFLMAGSLEFSKFVLAAYLHQTWKNLNTLYRSYLAFAVVVLSLITSLGIFGFLSQAYESASAVLESENIKLESIKAQKKMVEDEIARLNKSIDEIPAARITRRLKARAEIEPLIKELNKKFAEGEKGVTSASLKIIDVQKKVGPLMYISRSFKMDIDSVVKYLIFVFVIVFDPLAICLVIAATHALETRRNAKAVVSEGAAVATTPAFKAQEPLAPAETPIAQPTPQPVAEDAPTIVNKPEPEDIIVQMNFKDANEDKKAV